MKYGAVFCLLVCAAFAVKGQDNVERARVPLDNPSRPVRLRAHLISGGITVRGADVKDVSVEAHARDDGERRDENRHESRRPAPPGMKRLNLPGNSGLDITEEDNVVEVRTSPPTTCDLVITVPRHTSLQLKSINDGEIVVDGVEGEIDADDLNGAIKMHNVSGSVVAHSLNGAVTVSLDQVDSGKPMSFSTMNGEIDVTLPESVKANVRMKTDNGDIYSDFEVQLRGGSQVHAENGHNDEGRYHLRFDRGLQGTINGGGPDYQFTSFNGQIFLRKKK